MELGVWFIPLAAIGWGTLFLAVRDFILNQRKSAGLVTDYEGERRVMTLVGLIMIGVGVSAAIAIVVVRVAS